MTPHQPASSSMDKKEWRKAFKPRPCLICGTIITPAERTRNPSTAIRILTCSKPCKSKRDRSNNPPDKAKEKQRFHRWYAAKKKDKQKPQP